MTTKAVVRIRHRSAHRLPLSASGTTMRTQYAFLYRLRIRYRFADSEAALQSEIPLRASDTAWRTR